MQRHRQQSQKKPQRLMLAVSMLAMWVSAPFHLLTCQTAHEYYRRSITAQRLKNSNNISSPVAPSTESPFCVTSHQVIRKGPSASHCSGYTSLIAF